MSSKPTLRSFAAATTRGLRRPRNEDALIAAGTLLTGEALRPLCSEFGGDSRIVMAIADGMGGQPHGAVASREALTYLVADPFGLAGPEQCIATLRQTDLHLHNLMIPRPELTGMGTTLAGITLLGASLCWFNVGDSRIYRQRGSKLEQLSVDDRPPSLACQDREEPGRGVLQSLGGKRRIAPIYPHAGEETLVAGDKVLLCSDGLTDMISDERIAGVLEASSDPAIAVGLLISAALRAGGLDNASLILLQ